MKSNHEFYAKMLHKFDIDKRIESHLTEMIFRRKYANTRLSQEAVYGVIKSSRISSLGKYTTTWISPNPTHDRSNPAVPAPIRALMEKRKDDEFFIYHGEISDFSTGHIRLDIRKALRNGETISCNEIFEGEGSIEKKINSRINQINTQENTDQNRDTKNYISKYLPAFSDKDLSDLYISRCLMNYGIKFPSDIDAMDVDEENNFQIFEFKRKDSSNGYYKSNSPIRVLDYKKYWKEISKNSPPFADRQRVLEELQKIIPCHEIKEPCFGLDVNSHLSTLIDVIISKGTYNYVIWDRSPCKIEDLIDHKLNPVGSFNLIECRIARLDIICGFNFTEAKKSGSIHQHNGADKPRMQAMIKLSEFSKVAI